MNRDERANMFSKLKWLIFGGSEALATSAARGLLDWAHRRAIRRDAPVKVLAEWGALLVARSSERPGLEFLIPNQGRDLHFSRRKSFKERESGIQFSFPCQFSKGK